jgi:hypothetical protein
MEYQEYCPHPARRGIHEDYVSPDGNVYCRACGRTTMLDKLQEMWEHSKGSKLINKDA